MIHFLVLFVAASAPANAPKPMMVAAEARTVVVHRRDIVHIACRINVPTVIALPEGESAEIVRGGDAAADGGTWEYTTAKGDSPARRYVSVKPSAVGSSVGLHVISNHNIPYVFVLNEVSNTSEPADAMVFLVAGGDIADKVVQAPVLVSAEEANHYKQELAQAEAKIEEQRKASIESVQDQVNRYRASYSKQLDHGYSFDRLKPPFNVTDIANDGISTYVYVDPKHTRAGAVYAAEGKKNKASIPNYDYDAERGVYTIQGVLKRGYLQLKDDRLDFARLKGND